MDTPKFKVGDRVRVLPTSHRVAFPSDYLGINIVEKVEVSYNVQVLYFIGHPFQCHDDHVEYIPTPLEELL